MSIGVILTEDDLAAIKQLYILRWSAEIRNWKERNTDYCLWKVSCPDRKGQYITESGQSLAKIIYILLKRAL